MLEGKDCSAAYMSFTLIAVIIGPETGCREEPGVTTAHTMKSDFVIYLMLKLSDVIGSRTPRYNLEENNQNLKVVVKEIFGKLDVTNLFRL